MNASANDTPRPRRATRLTGFAFAAALVMAMLVVPRAETPHAVPLPPIDYRLLEQAVVLRRERVATAYNEPLSLAVRGIGERVRRYGLLERAIDEADAAQRDVQRDVLLQERRVLQRTAQELVQAGQDRPLLALRDLQFHLLTRALRDPAQQTEVWELGGRLEEYARRADGPLSDVVRGVLQDAVGGALAEATLHALFVRRWAEVVGLEKHPHFRTSANEWRLIHRFRIQRLLAEPPAKSGQHLLSALESTRQFSPQYPVDYARGIVLYRMGAFSEALDAFTRHMDAHPQGPWALRAQNFRLSAAKALVQ